VKSLGEICSTLTLALGSPALFTLVNTRIVLKTGIDLSQIRDDEDTSPDSVSRVLSALESMGYSTQALQMVARRQK
jgi:hypothetical protein